MEVGSYYQANSGSLERMALHGARTAMAEIEQKSTAIAAGELSPANLVAVKEQTVLYSINLKLIKMADDMVGQLLDLLA